jgi:hypothetical protein
MHPNGQNGEAKLKIAEAASALATEQDSQPAQLAARRPLEFEMQNVDDAWRMATMLAKSNLIPDALQDKPSDVLVTLLVGRELGLSPMQSLRLVYVVKGKPYIAAQLKIARVKQSPECLYFKCAETTADRATFETERKGEGKTSLTFTAEEARAAQLLGRQTKSGEPDNWAKYTALMLRWRAASQLCDLVYPDVVVGIGTEDEYQDKIRADEASRVYAPKPPAKQPERVVGSGATPKAAATNSATANAEQKSAEIPLAAEPEPHDPVTGEVTEEKPAPTAAPVEASKPLGEEPKGDDPDSFTERLKWQMSKAVEQGSLAALTKLASKAQEVPKDRQDEVLKHYQDSKAALKAKAQTPAGGAR